MILFVFEGAKGENCMKYIRHTTTAALPFETGPLPIRLVPQTWHEYILI